tara:strand:- start:1174 stop:2490 length:1317 start_codon:yes stop_codon:yes gene_type:complete
MAVPLIAIIGRPNVGKSTLFNRLLSNRQAIVDQREGITRDRIYGETEWCNQPLKFIDTGGYIPDDFDIFNTAVREQAQEAILEADMILFLVDGKEDITSSDESLAKLVRESNKRNLLVVNKCDTLKSDNQINQFYKFGLNTPLPVSALNGRYSGDILDAIISKLNLKGEISQKNDDYIFNLSIVGMPNVGKSSITNALLNKKRTIVTSIAGTTRDAIDSHLRWYGKNITLVDTAGLRRLAKIKDRIEYYSIVRTKSAIMKSQVVIVMIDAVKGFGKQDKNIVDLVIKNGKGLVVVVNKWDLIRKKTNTMKDYSEEIRYQFKLLHNYPILFCSAKDKKRIHKILETAWNVFKRTKTVISTRKLNQSLEKILKINPPSSDKGKAVKIKFATQVSNEPLVIAFYVNYPKLVKESYKRYLKNQVRKYFDFEGVPLKLSFRKK